MKLFIQKLALSATILPLAAVGAFASTSQTTDNPATITLPVAQGDPFPICPQCTIAPRPETTDVRASGITNQAKGVRD